MIWWQGRSSTSQNPKNWAGRDLSPRCPINHTYLTINRCPSNFFLQISSISSSGNVSQSFTLSAFRNVFLPSSYKLSSLLLVMSTTHLEKRLLPCFLQSSFVSLKFAALCPIQFFFYTRDSNCDILGAFPSSMQEKKCRPRQNKTACRLILVTLSWLR